VDVLGSWLDKAKGVRFYDDASPSLDSFGPLLALTAATVSALALVDMSGPNETRRDVAHLLVGLLIAATFLLALGASGVARRWRRGVAWALLAFAIVNGVAVAFNVAAEFAGDGPLAQLPSLLWVLVAVVTPVAVVRRLLRHQRVTTATILGAVAGYLLIALAFCYLLLLVDGFLSQPFFEGTTDDSSTLFMYFSLVSITTVGYGDYVAATDIGRLVAVSEAVVGQVYLVTFVAMLVGLLIQGRVAAARRDVG
jgi:hypothetical protein